MIVEPQSEKVGNDRFQGYCIDLIKEIAGHIGFNFTVKIVDDRKYGRRMENGEWDGMIRELIDGVSCVLEKLVMSQACVGREDQ